jgi:polyisoprenyl-teichoic acid--peptidoglycan teichoic acid transferase
MSRRRKLLAALGVVAALAAAALGVAWWQASTLLGQLRAGDKAKVVEAVQPELHRKPRRTLVRAPPEAHAQTILLIGSDHRWTGQNGARSDTVMLVRVDPKRHLIRLLSIPRDLYVAIPGHGHDRVNEAFDKGGEKLLTRTVREALGLRIDHFVEVDFRGFRRLVDDLDGIWVPVDQRYFNRNVGTFETNYADIDLEPGYQKLNGTQALAFARYRHDDSDLYRAARQQLVLREALHQTFAHPFDLLRLRQLARDFAQATTSDISSFGEVWSLAQAVRDARGIVRTTVAGEDVVLYGADYLQATEAQLKDAVARLLGAGQAVAPTPKPPAPKPPTPKPPAPKAAPQPVRLLSDGGQAGQLLAGLVPRMRRCVPRQLPPGYRWPEGAARSYVLDGHPAIALYATAGSGRSALWTFTTWQEPPTLEGPSETRTVGGRELELYRDSGTLRQVAWRVGATRVWLTNTLRNDLGARQMLALARSCD